MADENTSTQNEEAPGRGESTESGEQNASALAESAASKREAEVPPEVKRALAKANKEAETLRLKLKEYEDRDKTEAQKLAERATAAENQAAAAQTELMRYRVAADKKLPAELAARLRGSTPEEMAADADELLSLLNAQQQRQTPSYDGGVRQSTRPTSMNDLIRQTAGRG
jgi:hypothetical protein